MGGALQGDVAPSGPSLPMGGTVAQANPEMETGVVAPTMDYEDPEYVFMDCHVDSAKKKETPLIPDELWDDSAVPLAEHHLAGFLYRLGEMVPDPNGIMVSSQVPCCNGRVLRFVDRVTHSFIDVVTKNIEGKDGSFDLWLTSGLSPSFSLFVLPKDFSFTRRVSAQRPCQENDCVDVPGLPLTSQLCTGEPGPVRLEARRQ